MTLAERYREEGKVEVAKNLIVKGFSTEDIMDVTGFEEDDIERIKEKMVQ